jgi:hypothetical protein
LGRRFILAASRRTTKDNVVGKETVIPLKATRDAGQKPEDLGNRFINEAKCLELGPVSRRTWADWKVKGIVPFVRIGRRCLYSWPQVEAALLRRQRGPTFASINGGRKALLVNTDAQSANGEP